MSAPVPSSSTASSPTRSHQWLLLAAAITATAATTAALTSRYLKSQKFAEHSSAPIDVSDTSLPPVDFPTDLATTAFGTAARSSLFSLRPDTTFLNHGSYGTVPVPVQRYHRQLQQRVEAHPDMWFRFHSYRLVRQAAEQFAPFIGAASCDDVVFVTNATSAVNAVLLSLQLQPGDAILTPDLTYNACKLAMQSMAERRGAEYREVTVPLPSTAADMVQRVRECLDADTDRRIKFALFDTITSPTAVVFPVAEVCALCRSRGILTMLDAAHSLGQLPLDVSATHCDFLTTNCHKWCFGPKGSALLWVSPATAASIQIHPSITSHNWREQSLAKRFWQQGTRDDTAFATAAAGLSFYHKLGVQRVYEHNTALADWAVDHLSKRWGVRPNPLYAASMAAPFMRVLELPVAVPAEVRAAGGEKLRQFGDRTLERLLDEHELVVACFVYGERLYVRFSVQVYNCEADYVRLGELVASM